MQLAYLLIFESSDNTLPKQKHLPSSLPLYISTSHWLYHISRLQQRHCVAVSIALYSDLYPLELAQVELPICGHHVAMTCDNCAESQSWYDGAYTRLSCPMQRVWISIIEISLPSLYNLRNISIELSRDNNLYLILPPVSPPPSTYDSFASCGCQFMAQRSTRSSSRSSSSNWVQLFDIYNCRRYKRVCCCCCQLVRGFSCLLVLLLS